MAQYGLLIDYEFCSGCQSCEVACKEEHGYKVGEWGIHVHDEGPWQVKSTGEWVWLKIPVPTKLCDLCAERVGKGKEPTCVHHCLANCMKFGPIEELAADIAKKPKQVLWAPVETPEEKAQRAEELQRNRWNGKEPGQFLLEEIDVKADEDDGLDKAYLVCCKDNLHPVKGFDDPDEAEAKRFEYYTHRLACDCGCTDWVIVPREQAN